MGTLNQIIAIGVRLAAIFIFLWGLATLFAAIYVVQKLDEPIYYAGWIVIPLPFVMAVLMWRYPFFVAKNIVPKVEGDQALKDLSKNQVMVGVLTLVGVGILAVRIPDLFYWITFLINVHNFSEVPVKMFFPQSSLEGILTTVVEIGFGTWLMLGGEGILNTINRLRFAKPTS